MGAGVSRFGNGFLKSGNSPTRAVDVDLPDHLTERDVREAARECETLAEFQLAVRVRDRREARKVLREYADLDDVKHAIEVFRDNQDL